MMLLLSTIVLGSVFDVLVAIALPVDHVALDLPDSNSTKCHTWYSPSKLSPHICVCGDTLGRIIQCHDQQEVFVRNKFCMTYDTSTKAVLVGNCPYVNVNNFKAENYIRQPQNESELNKNLCDWANREGFMCSKCKDGLGVSVMTYDHKCVECIGNLKGWSLYLFLATVPTTLFFFIMIGCRIKTTSAHMNGIVCAFQMLTFYLDRYPNSITSLTNQGFKNFFTLGITIGGLWSLDFFRYIIPPFCITEKLNTLDVIAMEYVVAIYPLVLIITTYICIEIHDRGCKVLVIMWVPFKWCLSKVSWNIDLRSSIIDTFATFLLLSCSKLLFVSFNLLGHTVLFNAGGQQVGSSLAYYDASVPYLSKTHIPYFILSIVILAVFVLFPMVVIFLYPTKTFQRVLGYFDNIQWHPLHTFADAFNGCYKNGTNGSKDYRYFGAFYIFIRILYYLPALFWQIETSILLSLVPFTASLLFGIFRPYKNDFFNRVDMLLFGIIAFLHIWYTYYVYVAQVPLLVLVLLPLMPFIHSIIFIAYKFLSLCAPNFLSKFIKWSFSKKNFSSSGTQELLGVKSDSEDSDVPDRVRYPENYNYLVGSSSYGIENRNYGSMQSP